MGTAWCDSQDKLNFWGFHFPIGVAANSFCSCRESKICVYFSSVSACPLFPYFCPLQSLQVHDTTKPSIFTFLQEILVQQPGQWPALMQLLPNASMHVCTALALRTGHAGRQPWLYLYQLKARPFTSSFKRQSWIKSLFCWWIQILRREFLFLTKAI